MSYVLVIWTVVAMVGNHYSGNQVRSYDYRPIAEFHSEDDSAKKLCEQAWRDLGLEADRARCIRTK